MAETNYRSDKNLIISLVQIARQIGKLPFW
ncbi:hypothetical protein Goklo_021562 [Gossypium klotzschianum]|uniref:Uncharacterized protein n=1 Tax=Gossypium klotzschianum TaxID=34286 RepID=A0A7J8UVP1_9ROSI|nr:hypothetical protein [Gossypium klotzschianum]